jgi:hypothetical protein
VNKDYSLEIKYVVTIHLFFNNLPFFAYFKTVWYETFKNSPALIALEKLFINVLPSLKYIKIEVPLLILILFLFSSE